MVHDKQSGEEYTVTEEGIKGEVFLDELFKKARVPAPPARPNWPLVLTTGGALCIVLFYLLYRRRIKGKSISGQANKGKLPKPGF